MMVLLRHYFKVQKNLIGSAMVFSLLYGFLYSFFWIEFLSLKEFSLFTWINILLGLFLVSSDIYIQDIKNGFLDFLFSEGISINQVIWVKITFIFLGYFVPILCAAMINGLFWDQAWGVIFKTICGIIILSPAMIFLIHTGSLMIFYSYMNGFLIPVLMIPFFIPLFVFGLSLTMKMESDLLLGACGIDIFYCIICFALSKFLLKENFS